MIAVNVDNISVSFRNEDEIKKFGHLSDVFDVKDLGPIRYCLGMEFLQQESEATLRQSEYLNDMLGYFGMSIPKVSPRL